MNTTPKPPIWNALLILVLGLISTVVSFLMIFGTLPEKLRVEQEADRNKSDGARHVPVNAAAVEAVRTMWMHFLSIPREDQRAFRQ